jgi:hypothetical protein
VGGHLEALVAPASSCCFPTFLPRWLAPSVCHFGFHPVLHRAAAQHWGEVLRTLPCLLHHGCSWEQTWEFEPPIPSSSKFLIVASWIGDCRHLSAELFLPGRGCETCRVSAIWALARGPIRAAMSARIRNAIMAVTACTLPKARRHHGQLVIKGSS